MNFRTHLYGFFIFSLLLNCIKAEWSSKSELKSKIKSELKKKIISEIFSKLAKNIKSNVVKYVKKNIGPKYFDSGKEILKTTDKLNERYSNIAFIKRLIPHGYVTHLNDYDNKSYYVPLIRVHNVKPTLGNHGLNNEDFKGNFEIVNRLPKSPQLTKKHDAELLALFKELKPKTNTFQKILDDVRNYVEKIDTDAEVRRLKYALMSVLENHTPKNLRVRTTEDQRQKSIAHLYDLYEEESLANEKVQKKSPIPHYSFWNYWTYNKEIHQDHCNGNKLIQWGNKCIETPPH